MGVQGLAGVEHRALRVPKGAPIFRRGDVADSVLELNDGCVRLETTDSQGRRQVLAFMFPTDVIWLGHERRWATAEAVTECVITRYSLRSMPDQLARSLSNTLLASADFLLQQIAHHLTLLTRAPANERLAEFLSWLAERGRDPGVLDLPMSREDVADFLGIAPETVSRQFRQLMHDGRLHRIGPHRYLWPGPARPQSQAPPDSVRRIV